MAEQEHRGNLTTNRRHFLQISMATGLAAALPSIGTSETEERQKTGASKNKPTGLSPSELDEITIADLQAGLKSGKFTARSLTAKYLERIEGAYRNGNISEAEYNQAKQRKLEAELELQRAGAAASGDN